MASKGKRKLKRHEVICNENVINLHRFVYDAVVHAVSKLAVPQNCISRWEGPENDYGCDNFFLVMTRLVIVNQILNRYEWNMLFESCYEKNGLKSSTDVTSLMNAVASSIKKKNEKNIFKQVQILLSAITELVIFLYSKSLNLQLKNLANFWVDFLIPIKKPFQKPGGVAFLYNLGYHGTNKFTDIFNDLFISTLCLPYEESVKNKDLEYAFITLGEEFDKGLPPKLQQGPVSDDLVERFSPRMKSRAENLIAAFITHTASHPAQTFLDTLYSRRADTSAFVNPSALGLAGTFELPLTPQRAEDAQIDACENTGLGIRPHEELLREVGVSVADATSPQSLPGTSKERTKHRKGSSSYDKRLKAKYSSRSSVERVPGQSSLSSSGAKRSSEKTPSVLTAKNVPTTFENLPGTSREPTKHFSGSSTRLISKSSSISGVEQSFGQMKLDDFGTKQAVEKKSSVSTVLNVPKALQRSSKESQEPTIQPRRSSGLQKPDSSLGSSLKQGLEQPRLPSLGAESKKTSSPPVESNAPTATQDRPGKSRKSKSHHGKLSSRSQKSETSLGLNVEQGLGNLRFDSSETKRSGESNPSVSLLVQAIENRGKNTDPQPAQKKNEKIEPTSSSGEEEE